MTISLDRATSVEEALASFRAANGVPVDSATAPRWLFGLGPLRIHLPNFNWRRRAVERHDLHHILTGFPCSIRGEFQMAAWEFAAGRYPHPGATMICLPLIAGGAIFTPRSLWRAYRQGRRARSLYGVELTDTLRRGSVTRLRSLVGRTPASAPTRGDRFAFGWLVVQAILLTMLAVIAFGTLLHLAWTIA